MQTLEERVQKIEERNRGVETDKAWEISSARRVFIAVSTYIIAGVWLVVIHDTFPWLKAFVPAAGYLLSTLSLPFIKNWWASNQNKF